VNIIALNYLKQLLAFFDKVRMFNFLLLNGVHFITAARLLVHVSCTLHKLKIRFEEVYIFGIAALLLFDLVDEGGEVIEQ